MTNFEMFHTNTINDVEQDKVDEIKESMKKSGYIGTPIFYTNYILLTGSHRYEALKQLEKEGIEIEIKAIDLTNKVETYLLENDMDYTEIQYDVINDMDYEQITDYFKV